MVPRWANRTDNNQPDIVKDLRKMGFSVAPNHHDILVGKGGHTFWYEIKNPNTIGKNKKVRASSLRKSQTDLKAEWRGHYKVITSLDEILLDIKEQLA